MVYYIGNLFTTGTTTYTAWTTTSASVAFTTGGNTTEVNVQDWVGIVPNYTIYLDPWIQPTYQWPEPRLLAEPRPEPIPREWPQDRARALFCSLLTKRQQGRLKHSRYVIVRGSAGGLYRLFPDTGRVERVVRSRGMWRPTYSYCIHSPYRELPRADDSIGHLMLLRSDESAFLDAANATAV